MRVIGGIAKGRKLFAPKGDRVRPTADRVKEALFSILLSRLDSLTDCSILDLFAGTGNLGIEALSRGAARATFVDVNSQSADCIRKNLQVTGFGNRAELLQMDVLKSVDRLASENRLFHLIFIDPPYRDVELMHDLLRLLACRPILHPDGLIIFETGKNTVLHLPEGLETIEKRIYGDTSLLLIEQRITTIDEAQQN